MKGVTTSSTKSRHLCRIRRCSSERPLLGVMSSMMIFPDRALRRLAAAQEFAHALERAQDVLGRVGVGQPHVTFAQNAKVGAADNGDAAILQQRGGERL